MTKDDLKHAIISLVMGVLITAVSSIVMGVANIFIDWLSGAIGGTVTTITYLYKKKLL
ncbi:MAG: hypothetical protein AAB706_00675 [Patescibacteria group bacterium]